MPKIKFNIDGVTTEVDAVIGDTLLEVAKKNGVKIYGGCDGAGVCGTCHVYISEDYISKIDIPSESELDLLDVLQDSKSNSRLACQVVVTEAMDGMEVTK